MEKAPNTISANQPVELQVVGIILAERYQPEKIFCFNAVKGHDMSLGCFRGFSEKRHNHYFLLMVTKETTRKETEVQDYLNTHLSHVKITILVHGKASVEQAIHQGSRFFIAVYNADNLIYRAADTTTEIKCPNLNPKKQAIKYELYFLDNYDTAAGFLIAAESCCDREYYNNTLFMLHQTLEHACIALIGLFTGLRPATHSLTKSLNLCLCFSDEPEAFLPRKTPEEIRLFELLSSGYSDARYNNKLKVCEDDVSKLLYQLRDFLTLTRTLAYAEIEKLKIAAGIDSL